MATTFQYFLAFYRHAVKNGKVRQVDISRATGKRPQFWNRLYKGNPQSCHEDEMRSLANYLNISFEEMLDEGRRLLEVEKEIKSDGSQNNVIERKNVQVKDGITDPKEQEELLYKIIIGIGENDRKIKGYQQKTELLKEVLEENRILKTILAQLHEGVTFFDHNNDFLYSSNRWRFLDGLDLSSKPSIERIVVQLSDRIENFKPVLQTIYSVANQPPDGEKNVDVTMVGGQTFHFRIVPIYSDKGGEFLGTLLINTPVKNEK